MSKTILTIGVIILFICMSLNSISSIQIQNKPIIQSYRGNTLYVGGNGSGNYTRIQDAIDNASDGDTVYVYNGMYDLDEMIIVNKSIGIIGENKVNTIIDGSGISIVVSRVSISGFTIQNGSGIEIMPIFTESNNNTISGNIIKSNGNLFIGAITIINSSYNTISNNSFFNCGLWLPAYHNFVYNNTVNGKPLVYLEDASDEYIDDAGQVILISCNNITVKNLELDNAMIGVQLFGCINCYIINNVFLNNSFTGIFLFNSNNNIISGNIILNNTLGILFLASIFNMISRNSFKNNVYNLFLVISSCNLIQYNNFKYQKKISNILSGDSDNKYMGNFWKKPRLLPIIIWGFKTNRFGFIPFLPSLDVDWRPAKKPNDIDSTESRWAEFEIVIPRTRASNLQYLRLLEQYPLLKQFPQKLPFCSVIDLYTSYQM